MSHLPLRAGAVAGAAAVAASVVAASAVATIVPSQGFAGVQLRMSEGQVLARLGTPVRTTRSRGALGTLVTRLHYARVDVDIQDVSGTPLVVRELTTRQGERTAAGVGVGSTLAAVRRLRGVRCWWEGSAHYCGIGNRNTSLSRVTTFWIDAKQRVTLVSVSLVVNS